MPGGNNPFNPRPGGRRPSYRGVFQRDVTQGVERVRKWPKPRGRPKTQAEKDAQDKFKWANQATKYMAPAIVAQFTRAVKGTPLMPRDLLIAQLYDRLAMIVIDGVGPVWPESAWMQVSEALDVITSVPGSILVRGATRWEQGTLPQVAEIKGPVRFSLGTQRDNVTGDGTIYQVPLDTALGAIDALTLNTATGVVTVNESGFYSIDFMADLRGGAAHDDAAVYIYVNGNIEWQQTQFYTDEPIWRAAASYTARLEEGDQVTLRARVSGSTKTVDAVAGGLSNVLRFVKIG